ncbi:MAG TPA: 3-hydroxyacyl-CoA dehydrogenase NAD-binding domain-containing protein [Steroidobacteraceae bacterium]|nr:3-hydroxyacyl-CoA dehydrogenase NAD-binding domain-containing protein [Steroidobacteraceae bacterium]
MSKLSFETTHGVAVLKLANPPVNSFGFEMRRLLWSALARAEADASIRAIILIGSGKGFSGGADISEFGTPQWHAEPNLTTLLQGIEQCAKPIVAAIEGICIGGGLEMALACHYRVGAPSAQIALPEVKLGLLPGAGGTQRLPRFIGIEAALNMIVSGDTVRGEKLRGTALFDVLSEGDLLTSALDFAWNLIAEKLGPRRVRDQGLHMPNAEAYFQFARNTIKAKAGPYPAPMACVEAVAAAVREPFDQGMKRERELFNQLLLTPESAALRHIFQAERAASHIGDVPESTPTRPINKVAVIGAGTMGGGIAMTLINAGLQVVLVDASQDALERGLARIRRNYQSALRKGTLDEANLEKRLALIHPTLSYDALRDVDLAIEAVFEGMDVKREVFENLDAIVKPGALLASNTSTLNLDDIANSTRRPQDVIGLHFFSPANVMRLLEVVRGAKTSKEVLATAMRLAKKLGKVAVVSGVCDGFIGNRMVARYGQAADELLLAGAMPQQIDAALQRFGMAMGPFRMIDLAGLDIAWAIRKRRAAESPGVDSSNPADTLCEAGRLGQKTGAGWYRYEAGSRNAIPDPEVNVIVDKFRRQRGLATREVSEAEIVERCIYALVNEGARIVEEGIAQRSSDVDIVYLNGYGFPAHRGGPMFYADQTGLSKVAGVLRRVAASPGADVAFWTPAPLLARLALEGGTFTESKRSRS